MVTFFYMESSEKISIPEPIANDYKVHTPDMSGTLPYLEKGYGDVRPLRPPFHALSAVP